MKNSVGRQYICVFIKSAEKWREKGHTHWFVCKKCKKRIAYGLPVWIEGKETPNMK